MSMMTYLVMPLVVWAVGIALGWWLKGRFGARAAADLQTVTDTAKKL